MTATATSNYIGGAMRATVALAPPSLADNPGLLAWNLFVMTAPVPRADDGGQAGATAMGRAQHRSPHGPGFRLSLHRLSGGVCGREPRRCRGNQPIVVKFRRRRHDSADLGTKALA
jgi:hypothetical protein